MPSQPKKFKSPYPSLPDLAEPDVLARLLGIENINDLFSELESMVIEDPEISSSRASATIDKFQTRVHYRASGLEGECTCPDSDGFEFCKHCAALCLHVNKHLQQISALDKGPDKSKVMAYLLTLDKQSLSKQLLDFISEDAEQFDRYLIKATLSRREIDYAQLKARITELTKIKERLFSQRQVKHFFSKIERLLNEFSLVESYPEPEKMLKVVEYALQRITKVLEQLEDNSGQRAECVESLRELYSRLFRELGGRDDTKLKRIVSIWMIDQFDLLPEDISALIPVSMYDNLMKNLEQELEKRLKNTVQGDPWLSSKLLRTLVSYAEDRKDEKALIKYRKLLR